MNYHAEISLEHIMWRKSYEDAKRHYLLGYLSAVDFMSRLNALGFRGHEIKAELDLLATEKGETSL